MKKKKVLFLIHDLGHGGAERVLVNLVNNMDKSKFDVTLQSVFNIGIHRNNISNDVNYIFNFNHMLKGNSWIMKLFPPNLLFKFLIKEDYDIIVSYLEGTPARIVSGCPKKIKSVCWIHVQLDSKKAISGAFRSFNEAKKCYKSFNQLIAVSETVKSCFCKNSGIDSSFVKVLYNTNETELIVKKSNEDINDIVFEDKIFNICSVGRVIDMKGYLRLAHVHKRLIYEGIQHRIYILGTGGQQQLIEKYVNKNHLNSSFIFLGFKENPYKYMKKCDLYVCSSYREGFSTAVTESLIVGTPVISTLCSGAQELLGYNNEYGMVVENSEKGLYNGLKYLLTCPNELNRYRELAEKRGTFFSKEKTVKAVEEMFQSL